MNYGQIVSRVKAEGGFDVSGANVPDSSVRQWVQDVYAEMCVEAKWVRAVKQIAATVNGQAQYSWDTIGIHEILKLYVATTGFGGYGPEYPRIGFGDLQKVKAGEIYLRTGTVGVFGEAFDVNGVPLLELYPAPTADAVAITAEVNLEPPVLGAVNGDSDVPLFPVEIHPGLVYGAAAVGLEFVDEGDPTNFRTKFEEYKGKLSRLARKRLGSGPVQIQVAGYHF